jgi:hypothetical protein
MNLKITETGKKPSAGQAFINPDFFFASRRSFKRNPARRLYTHLKAI